jgi:Lon protease-like protein
MRLPLFPLSLVLFPGQTIALHIFEDRYKAMLKRCLDDQIPFGIVLIKDGGRFGRGTPHSIGTTARVMKVDEVEPGACRWREQAPHRGGCFNIAVRGEERFRVTSLDRREAEYLVGEVEMYPDEHAPEPAMLMVAQRVASLFDEYYRGVVAVMGNWQRTAEAGEQTLMFNLAELRVAAEADDFNPPRRIPVPSIPTDPMALANFIAGELSIQPFTRQEQIKQELLEAPSTLARLQREAEILAEETPQIEERIRLRYRRRFGEFGRTN